MFRRDNHDRDEPMIVTIAFDGFDSPRLTMGQARVVADIQVKLFTAERKRKSAQTKYQKALVYQQKMDALFQLATYFIKNEFGEYLDPTEAEKLVEMVPMGALLDALEALKAVASDDEADDEVDEEVDQLVPPPISG